MIGQFELNMNVIIIFFKKRLKRSKVLILILLLSLGYIHICTLKDVSSSSSFARMARMTTMPLVCTRSLPTVQGQLDGHGADHCPQTGQVGLTAMAMCLDGRYCDLGDLAIGKTLIAEQGYVLCTFVR